MKYNIWYYLFTFSFLIFSCDLIENTEDVDLRFLRNNQLDPGADNFIGVKLLSPEHGKIYGISEPSLSWEAHLSASTYQIQLSNSSLFNSLIIDEETVDTVYDIVQGLDVGKYFWRARYGDTYGEFSPWSSARIFTIVSDIPRLIWASELYGQTRSAPAVADTGDIYLPSMEGFLYAFSAEGRVKWGLKVSKEYWDHPSEHVSRMSCPSISDDGTIYMGIAFNSIIAINPDGTKKWETETTSPVEATPAIMYNGTVVVGSHDGTVYALQPNGSLRWVFYTGEFTRASPAVTEDTVYISSGALFAIDYEGTLKWQYNGSFSTTPAIDSDGTVYIGNNDGELVAISSTGQMEWYIDLANDSFESSPVIGPAGNIYIGSGYQKNKLFAVSRYGQKLWEISFDDQIQASPTIGDDGTVYIFSSDGYINALDSNGSRSWRLFIGQGHFCNSLVRKDGSILIGSKELNSILTSSKGMASSSWPTIHGNAKRNGRIQVY